MARKTHRFRIGYTRPSFLEGMARIFDFSGALNQYDMPYLEDLRAGRVPELDRSGKGDVAEGFRRDAEALRGDWEAVGQYLYDALGKFEEENDLPPGSWQR